MSTSLIIKAQGGGLLYDRTMEWGGFEPKSELILVPCGTAFTSDYFSHAPLNCGGHGDCCRFAGPVYFEKISTEALIKLGDNHA